MESRAEISSSNSDLRFRRSSGTSTLPPEYEDATLSGAYELNTITPSSSQTSLPQYEAVYKQAGSSSANAHNFHPTKQLQIETKGHSLVALPIPPRPDPIYIFNIDSAGEQQDASPEYVSIRQTRGSGNCILVKSDDPQQIPLAATTYRFGPGKPPKIKLSGSTDTTSPAYGRSEEISVNSKGALTRSTNMRTPLGTFEWRYASRAERKAAAADNLLVMDRIVSVAIEGGKQEKRRHRVAQLVRSDKTRTEGTERCTAGNGGRLMLDLREWEGQKGEVAAVEVLAVASCITMLKKEIDRRRIHQTMVFIAVASSVA